ncbi:uncharacterized protein LOC110642687 [Hevea brasiliensis]|uniref:uncharacterized protein LOC110642687 n=1 Tax=Hevea brasiliensis TaxID=3981 RepID=UPI000B778153|nr:uncharacterized protein LOC110642687 [Hevea brasiliensis]
MTRSGIVTQDSMICKLEVIVRVLQIEPKKDRDDLREEMKQHALQSAIEIRQKIREKLQAIFGDSLPDKTKGSDPGVNEEVGTSIAVLGSKGILPNTKVNQQQGGIVSNGSAAENEDKHIIDEDQLLGNYDKSNEDQNASSEVFNKNDKGIERERDFLADTFGINEDSKEENNGEEDNR